jgi:HAD superfamily hydrolase (TIGR01509 family)
MSAIQCIIFDCDGVLVDSEILSNRILLDMGREHGLDMTLEQAITDFGGRGLKECFSIIEQRAGCTLPEDFIHTFRSRTYEIFHRELQPVQGMPEFLDTLAIDRCVASSGPPEKIRLSLSITGLIGAFGSNIFSSYDINSWKPRPDIFLHAARSMGHDVANCVVIEDSVAGVQAARAGGFRVFGLAHDYNQEQLREAGAHVFHDVRELNNLLGF